MLSMSRMSQLQLDEHDELSIQGEPSTQDTNHTNMRTCEKIQLHARQVDGRARCIPRDSKAAAKRPKS